MKAAALICSVDAEVIVDIVGERLRGCLFANLSWDSGLKQERCNVLEE
jgi:hypothetical protein